MRKYQHLFFDLDHTLWDFESNSQEVLEESYERFKLAERGIGGQETFISRYRQVNEKMWDAYRKGTLQKKDLRLGRFTATLKTFSIDDEPLAHQIGEFYLHESPRRTHLMPHTLEVLEYARKSYQMHILTNGFEEVQAVKMECSGLSSYFDHVITSEQVGVRKPHPMIFKHAMEVTGANATSSLMIGDNLEVDVLGARDAGWDGVYFNPMGEKHNENITAEIKSLEELLDLI